MSKLLLRPQREFRFIAWGFIVVWLAASVASIFGAIIDGYLYHFFFTPLLAVSSIGFVGTIDVLRNGRYGRLLLIPVAILAAWALFGAAI